MTCECGLDKPFSECCGRFLTGQASPATTEELLRSRFVAFGMSDFDYIEKTQMGQLAPEVRERKAPEWESLEILESEGGGIDDTTGMIEFVAHYHLNGCRNHRERCRFVRVDGLWSYIEGEINDEGTVKRGAPKVGRNDPCPCGSGNKFKRCCGLPG